MEQFVNNFATGPPRADGSDCERCEEVGDLVSVSSLNLSQGMLGGVGVISGCEWGWEHCSIFDRFNN